MMFWCMRTTLTLDEDVAIALEKVRDKRSLTFKAAVNEALRRGLQEMAEPEQERVPYTIKPVSLGGCLLDNLDDVAEVLAFAEGEDFK
jgi:hypothetical protein